MTNEVAGAHLPSAIAVRRALSPREAAAFLGVSLSLLERWRNIPEEQHKGPPFVRISERRVGYRVTDLEAFFAKRMEGGGR